MRSRHIEVTVDLDRVRAAAERIRAMTSVALIAVIKADAYGLGAVRVADVLAGVADEFAYFSVEEARRVRRPGIVLGPASGEPTEYRELGLRPGVGDRAEAERCRGLRPLLNVDTGMQRFGCRAEEIEELLTLSGATEAFTHADGPGGAARLRALCAGRVERMHAAGSALLDEPAAWLDAVRPGLALYAGAVRVTARLAKVRETGGRIGYTGFETPRVGVILVGYSQHLRCGPVLINGRWQRVLEVGMNTAYVSVDAADREGDAVVLLGDGLTETEVAAQCGARPHEILCHYTALGERRYVTDGRTVSD